MRQIRADLPHADRDRGPGEGGEAGQSDQSVVDFFAAAGILADEEEGDDQDIDDDGDAEDDAEVTDG